MKDATGKELQIGQFVATSLDSYTNLAICEVTSFTKQKVILTVRKIIPSRQPCKISYSVCEKDMKIKFPEQVVIVEINDVETLLR